MKQLLPVEFVLQKRRGEEHSPEAIAHFIEQLVSKQFAPEQAAAWAMAVYFKGLTAAETSALTKSMAQSGETISFGCNTVDKHSTGGVGDKTSVIIAPAVAAAGCHVPMMSGRGLGHTGGTTDKLEGIPGFRTEISLEDFRKQVEQLGCALITQTPQIAPADKILYGLRDITGTVESVGLITASILSKKFAEGTRNLVMDVKHGNGAFMKTKDQAEILGASLKATGGLLGIQTEVIYSPMDQILGWTAGNNIEIRECIDILKNLPQQAEDLTGLSRRLGSTMIRLYNGNSPTEALRLYEEAISSGRALEKFRQVIQAQGGDPRVIDQPEKLLPLAESATLEAPFDGVITEVDTYRLGMLIVAMGGGRDRPGAKIDHTVGMHSTTKIGQQISRGEPLLKVFHRQPKDWLAGALDCFRIKRQ